MRGSGGFGRVAGTYFQHPRPGLARLDVADEGAIAAAFAELRPSVVVLVAGWASADRCERDPRQSERYNVDAARIVARACARAGARLVCLSTDYVFDGDRGPY